ncbi:MAG: uroporphyrinogen-III synthase [Acidimicrobiia bacterium]|nr:uroporphyrinogen-III synthase [Acidimicrobiia bacterium]
MTRRVAVTTTTGRSFDRIADELRDTGLQPVPLPCITVEPAAQEVLDRLRSAADSADWIVVTSRRAVEIVWPSGGMPTAPAVAAVGPTTAEAAREAGGRVEVIGSGGASELCDVLGGRVAGTAVVFPHARAADPATSRSLAEQAASVVAEPAYDTVPIAPGPDPVDAAIFGSPSAVDGWMTARSLEDLVTAAMGPTTAAHLRRLGRPPDVVPERPDLARLVGMLADHLAHERQRS